MDGFGIQELGTRNANVESRSENCQGESVLYVDGRTYDLCSYSNYASTLIQVPEDTPSNIKKKNKRKIKVIVTSSLPFERTSWTRWG